MPTKMGNTVKVGTALPKRPAVKAPVKIGTALPQAKPAASKYTPQQIMKLPPDELEKEGYYRYKGQLRKIPPNKRK